MSRDQIIIINQSGRGDKDIFTVADALNDPEWKTFIQTKAAQTHA
jgi:tryptophan synthase beta chain